MPLPAFSLRKAIGPNDILDPDDVFRTKDALGRLGHYVAPEGGLDPWPDPDLIEALKSFQRKSNLRVDGTMNPGGPTAAALGASLDRLGMTAGEWDWRTDRPKADTNVFVPAQSLTPRPPWILSAASESNPQQRTMPDPANDAPPPANKVDFPERHKDRRDFKAAVKKLPGSSAREVRISTGIYGREGGARRDPESTAVAGVTARTFDDLVARGKLTGIAKGTSPGDLSAEDRAAIYRAYIDDVLHTVGGRKALESISDDTAAEALADTLFMHGRADGTKAIQSAIDNVRPGIVRIDGRMGPATLETFVRLSSNEKTRNALLDALANARGELVSGHPNERGMRRRFDQFRSQK